MTYRVSWQPISDVVAEAMRLGMKEGDGTSFWDWMDPYSCEKSREFPFWQPAVTFAKKVAKKDVFGAARIQKMVKMGKIEDRDDCWEVEATWDVTPGEFAAMHDPDYND